MLGERKEAARYVRKVNQSYPDFTVDGWLSIVPIGDPAVRQRYEEGLRGAGFH